MLPPPISDQMYAFPENDMPVEKLHDDCLSLPKDPLDTLLRNEVSLSSLSQEQLIEVRPYCISLMFANSLVEYVLEKKRMKWLPVIDVQMFEEYFENPFRKRIGRLVLTYIRAIQSDPKFMVSNLSTKFHYREKLCLLRAVYRKSFVYGFNPGMLATLLGLVFVIILPIRCGFSYHVKAANATVNYIAEVMSISMQFKHLDFHHFDILEQFAYEPDENKRKKSLIRITS